MPGLFHLEIGGAYIGHKHGLEQASGALFMLEHCLAVGRHSLVKSELYFQPNIGQNDFNIAFLMLDLQKTYPQEVLNQTLGYAMIHMWM